MTDDHMSPSPFLASWIAELAARMKADAMERGVRRALDVAMGRGRHALLLAEHGFTTFGVDVNCSAIRDAVHSAALHGLRIHGWCADLTVSSLPVSAFDVVEIGRAHV